MKAIRVACVLQSGVNDRGKRLAEALCLLDEEGERRAQKLWTENLRSAILAERTVKPGIKTHRRLVNRAANGYIL